MSILRPTDIYGEITFLGVVADSEKTLRSDPHDTLTLAHEGPVGESHSGQTRPSCVRVKLQYPKGTEITNARQVSVLSVEELAEIAAKMGIDAIAPEWTGATMVVKGIPDLTTMPPSSRLVIESGASIVNDMENGPCKFVGQEIEREYPGKGLSFPKHAVRKRGICGWVERPGEVSLGMKVRLHVPPKVTWNHA